MFSPAKKLFFRTELAGEAWNTVFCTYSEPRRYNYNGFGGVPSNNQPHPEHRGCQESLRGGTHSICAHLHLFESILKLISFKCQNCFCAEK